MFPLMGWNEYTIEGARTSCCVNMSDRRLSFVLYNLILFICVYLIPLIILLTTNTIIYLGLQRMKEKITHGAKADFSQKRIEMERRILKSKELTFLSKNENLSLGIIITVCGFIFTWTPYAIVFFITVFGSKTKHISPSASFMCTCFAKTSVMWIPILYIGTSTYFKFRFVDMSSMDKNAATSQDAGQGINASMETKGIQKTTTSN